MRGPNKLRLRRVSTMHPFRTAILMFLIGASVANYFAMKKYSDRIEATIPSSVDPLNPFGGSETPGKPNLQARLEFSQNADEAWMREAIIFTIAGVAWFLVRPKPVS